MTRLVKLTYRINPFVNKKQVLLLDSLLPQPAQDFSPWMFSNYLKSFAVQVQDLYYV